MKIKAERVVNKNGDRMYRFVSFSGMTRAENLPKQYILKRSIYPTYSGDGVICINKPVFCPIELFTGQMYTQEEWENFIIQVKKSVKRLRKINAEIRAIKEVWKGESNYIY